MSPHLPAHLVKRWRGVPDADIDERETEVEDSAHAAAGATAVAVRCDVPSARWAYAGRPRR